MLKRSLLLILMVLAITSCKKPSPPGAKYKHLIVLVGGLGDSRVKNLAQFLREDMKEVVEAANWDGYNVDLVKLLSGVSYEDVTLIGHSFGASRVLADGEKLPNVKQEILLDPIGLHWEPELESRKVVPIYVFYRDSSFGPPRARIKNPHDEQVVAGDHNSMTDNRIMWLLVSSLLN